MKTKQEQIEEMMLDVPQTIVAYDANPKGQQLYGEQREYIAEALYDAGYRREATLTCDFIKMAQKHAVQEFVDELRNKCSEVKGYYYSFGNISGVIEELLEEYKK